MDTEHSESPFPFGIGASFLIVLLSLMLGGGLTAWLFSESFEQSSVQQGGGIILLVIFLVTVVGPVFYNKKASRFERERTPLDKIDHFGMIQGLRGASIRIVLYAEGLEVRAFYHRYYLPFDKMDAVDTERQFLYGSHLVLKTRIEGVPSWISLPEEKRRAVAAFVQNGIRSSKSNSAGG